MSKIAVHLHVYYPKMVDLFLDRMENVSDADIFVTMVEENMTVVEKIKASFPRAVVWVVENRGYDIGPFVSFLKMINLDEYDYILKLHTKSPNGLEVTRLDRGFVNRKTWLKLLLDSLLENEKIWRRNLQLLEKKTKVGMIGSGYLIDKHRKGGADYSAEIKKELDKQGLPKIENFKFVAGTMFVVRANLMQVIKNNYSIENFGYTNAKQKDGDFAHLFERLLGAVVIAQGYEVRAGYKNLYLEMLVIWEKFRIFMYHKKLDKKNRTIIKICKIMVYRK